jgi:PAS domain S-box-containing protein
MGREVFPLYEAYVEAALAGERTGFEHQLSVPGRPAIWIHVDSYPDRGTDGDVRGFLVCYANIDQLKRLELEAGGREHRLRLVTDSVGSPIIHFDRNLKLRFANKPFGDWIGVAPDDLLGRRVQELITGGTFADMDEHIDRAFSGAKVSFERRERKATGELRWVRITLFPDRAVGGRVDGIFAVMTDIDDDIGIRDALREQEVQLRLFADNIPGPIAYLDRASTYTFVNQAFANWVCLPQEQIYGRTPFEVLSPGVASFLRPVLERAHGGEHVEYERVDSRANGEQRWVHGRVAPDFDADGKLRGIYCTEYDIHDLKRTEQALAAREEQLRLFTDNIPDPIVYLDTERCYAFVNDAFLQLERASTGATVIGKTTAEVVGLENTTDETPYQDRAFAGETVSFERALVDASGRSRWMRGRMVPDHRIDGAIQGIYVVLHDITDLKIAQDTLAARESQLRAVMDGVPAPVAYIDRDERCQYVNRAFLRYFGVDADKITTLRLRDVIGPAIFESAQAVIARALDGESAEFDRLIPGANGETRWMTIRVVPDSAPRATCRARRGMNDIHGLKQAQKRCARRVGTGLIMDNVPARRVHRSRSSTTGS